MLGCTPSAAFVYQCKFLLSSVLNDNALSFLPSTNDIIFASFDQSCCVDALAFDDKNINPGSKHGIALLNKNVLFIATM